MWSGVWRCATGALPRRVHRHLIRLFAISMSGLAAAGCNINGEPLGSSFGPLASARTATIAIESIDGPPPALARKVVKTLGEEAEARQLVIVPQEDGAQYRVRGYLSTHVERGKTSITWVWDVYGADKRRALRITGEEPSDTDIRDANKRDDWAAVDERMLRRIAQSGMNRILVFLNSSQSASPFSVPETAPLTTNLTAQPPRS